MFYLKFELRISFSLQFLKPLEAPLLEPVVLSFAGQILSLCADLYM